MNPAAPSATVQADKLGHWLDLNGMRFRCAIGRGGVGQKGGEGDGVTPVGAWPLRQVLYRADRLDPPITALICAPIAADDGWCNDPDHADYNRPVTRPCAARHERLWRDDAVYDLVVVLGYNDDPVAPGKGSAIFMHVATPDYAPTEGCVALNRDDLLAFLAVSTPGSMLSVLG